MDKQKEIIKLPCGLTDRDTIEDALKRADSLAGINWHSGLLCSNKDLRRIVLLAYDYRKQLEKIYVLNSRKE